MTFYKYDNSLKTYSCFDANETVQFSEFCLSRNCYTCLLFKTHYSSKILKGQMPIYIRSGTVLFLGDEEEL